MCSSEFGLTYLARNTMRTQFSKTKRRLNPTQHSDNIDVLYTAAARRRRTQNRHLQTDAVRIFWKQADELRRSSEGLKRNVFYVASGS